MRAARVLVRLGVLLFAVVLGGAILLERGFEAPGPLAEEVVVHVPRGSGLAATADALLAAGAIRSADRFALGSWLRGGARSLKAGEYRISPGASMASILAQIRAGRVVQRRLLIREGSSAAEVAAALAAAPYLAGDIPAPPAEGSVAPDTYFFLRGDGRQALLDQMRDAQDRILAELWAERAAGLPFDSPAEALVLASIIEKETAVGAERGLVASVFINRLRRGMRLQSDPTVIYGLTGGRAPLGRELLRRDLRDESPYNTYRHHGLPPGPICNPGRAAIAAALQPEESDYLYFVADGSGGHAFATNLAAHNRNVANWRRSRRAGGVE